MRHKIMARLRTAAAVLLEPGKDERDDTNPGAIISAGVLVKGWRTLLNAGTSSPGGSIPDPTRVLRWEDLLILIKNLTGLELEVERADENFATSVGAVRDIFREELGITGTDVVSDSREIPLAAIITIIERSMGIVIVDVTGSDNADVHPYEASDVHRTDSSRVSADTVSETIFELTCILDMADSADSDTTGIITPMWAVDKKYDYHQPSPDELIERPWEDDPEFQAAMDRLDERRFDVE